MMKKTPNPQIIKKFWTFSVDAMAYLDRTNKVFVFPDCTQKDLKDPVNFAIYSRLHQKYKVMRVETGFIGYSVYSSKDEVIVAFREFPGLAPMDDEMKKFMVSHDEISLVNAFRSFETRIVDSVDDDVKANYAQFEKLKDRFFVSRALVSDLNTIADDIKSIIRRYAKSMKQIIFTGYGYGGALAELTFLSTYLGLCRYCHKLRCHTYGQCAIGNKKVQLFIEEYINHGGGTYTHTFLDGDEFVTKFPEDHGFRTPGGVGLSCQIPEHTVLDYDFTIMRL